MNFAFIQPCGERSPLRYVQSGVWQGDHVQNILNAVPGDLWEGNEICDGGTVEKLATYDLILLCQNTQQYGITCDLASRLADAKTKVTALDGGSLDDISISSTHCRRGLIDTARAVDMYFTFQPAGNPLYELVTNKPVRFLGVAMPTKVLERFRKQTTEDFVVLGIQLGIGSGVDRNGLLNAFAVQKALPGVRMVVAYTHDEEVDFAKQYLPNAILHKVVGNQHEYWDKVLSRARLCVILDSRYTWGRFAGDCAGLGVPCVGVNRSGTQQTLWPSLTLNDPFKEMDKAVDLIRRAYSDDGLRSEACVIAKENIEQYFSEPATAARLCAAAREMGIDI